MEWYRLYSVPFPNNPFNFICVYSPRNTSVCVFGFTSRHESWITPIAFKQIGFIAVREREIKKGKEKEKGEIER